MKYALAVAVVVLALSAGAIAQHPAGHEGGGQQMHQPLTDASYVEMMTMHHENGIKMGQMAAEKASNTQVKALASTLVAEQQKDLDELEQLKAQVKSAGMDMEHGMMGKEHAGMMKKMPMEHLEQSSGPAFDRMFLDMMIRHHQEAVRMSREAKLSVPAVKEFALRTRERQEKQVKDMQQLRKQIG